MNSSIKEVTLNIRSKEELSEIRGFLEDKGDTIVNINISNELEAYKFKLKNLRNIDRKSINILRNKQFDLLIH